MASLLDMLPPDFGLVVLVLIASIFVVQWMAFQVGRARRKFGIKLLSVFQYPTMYSDKEPLFNCIQRAHQNTLEGYPVFLVLLLLGGIQYPVKPKNRNRGAFGYLALLTLLGCNISLALTLLGYI
ncbi:hypothetical protein LSH36_814g01028 [Paralvinella palmiformis]|uniref:MAPEG family protein n=1 Tax=Paralvinella palmiformis TaxID=53620 RepID=A0AAD9MUT0_9ANNE|nr:hypothetical protein LSH36_814g01028 [Paralvinella palmiformis]